jgi:Raf kinase inhibitor-like YbhB/YbcL family protein
MGFARLSFTQPGCGKHEDKVSPGGTTMTIELQSPAFQEGETIPKQYTGDGKDTSPPLRWPDPPAGTKSFALICDDPDAPRGTWTHWVLYNLPSDRRQLDEGVPARETIDGGAKQGKNDFGKVGYGGPAPPAGKPHRYHFRLYALDREVDLPAGAGRQLLLGVMKGHVLAEGQLMGRYGR